MSNEEAVIVVRFYQSTICMMRIVRGISFDAIPIIGQSIQIALVGGDVTGINASGKESKYGKNASRSFHCSACNHRVGRCSSGNHGEAPQRNGSFCRRRHRVRARIAVLTIGVRVLGTSVGAPLLGLSQCVG